MIVILISREETARDTREKHYMETKKCTEDSYVKMKAEIGVILPEVKEHLWLQKLEMAKKDSPLEASEAVRSFLTSGLQKCERIHFCSFKPSSLWHFNTDAFL